MVFRETTAVISTVATNVPTTIHLRLRSTIMIRPTLISSAAARSMKGERSGGSAGRPAAGRNAGCRPPPGVVLGKFIPAPGGYAPSPQTEDVAGKFRAG